MALYHRVPTSEFLARWTADDQDLILAWERINGPLGQQRDDLVAMVAASNTIAPHVKGRAPDPAKMVPYPRKPKKQSVDDMQTQLSMGAR